MRGPSVRDAHRLARGGVLEQYSEHCKQAQRSNGGPMACFDRQVDEKCGLGLPAFAEIETKQNWMHETIYFCGVGVQQSFAKR